MRTQLEQLIYRIRGSYWFIPLLMAVSAIILSQSAVQFDRYVGEGWMRDSWWASLNQPAGARALLATVAGSMITVTGVTFSLTILAVSHATSHFGPRLLDNFMRDRGNQVTLGTFAATFLFCLLVLRTVRDESTANSSIQAFVPHVSILIALALTLASVGVLIYFIHHIPESIHISNVLNDIAIQLTEKIKELYPEAVGEPAVPRPDEEQILSSFNAGIPVFCRKSGYLQGVDETSLMGFTLRHDVRLQLLVHPGQYLLSGQRIAVITGDFDADALEVDSAEKLCSDGVHSSLAIGVVRTPTDDVYFLLNQYVEVATRALSPGVNDPFTAMQCLDQISSALVDVSSRSMPVRFRDDEDGNLRIVVKAPTWSEFVDRAMGRLVPYVKTDVNVTSYMLDCIDQVTTISQNAELNAELADLRTRLDHAQLTT